MNTKEYPTKTELLSLFSYKDGNLFWLVKKSRNTVVGSKAGHKRSDGYSHVIIDGSVYQLHRLIFIYHFGEIEYENVIDHKDGNVANNQIENLQSISQQLNMSKSKKPKNNTSGYKGVAWNSRAKKWQVQIQYKGKMIYLGYFNCPTKGAIEYDKKSKELYGSNGFRNFGP